METEIATVIIMSVQIENICLQINDIEVEGEVQFDYYPGYNGNRFEPSEDPEFEFFALSLNINESSVKMDALLEIEGIKEILQSNIEEIWNENEYSPKS